MRMAVGGCGRLGAAYLTRAARGVDARVGEGGEGGEDAGDTAAQSIAGIWEPC